jgi:hypothetical protein
MVSKPKRPRKKTPAPKAAEPYTVLVYRVNGVLAVPIPAGTPPDEGRRLAVTEVLDAVRMQPGGPRLFFVEARAAVVGVAEADRFEAGEPFWKGPIR